MNGFQKTEDGTAANPGIAPALPAPPIAAPAPAAADAARKFRLVTMLFIEFSLMGKDESDKVTK
jgi:hypothetical protein